MLAVHVTPECELPQEEHVDDGYVSDEFFDDDELPSRFQGWLPAHDDVPRYPGWALSVRLGVHVRSSCE